MIRYLSPKLLINDCEITHVSKIQGWESSHSSFRRHVYLQKKSTNKICDASLFCHEIYNSRSVTAYSNSSQQDVVNVRIDEQQICAIIFRKITNSYSQRNPIHRQLKIRHDKKIYVVTLKFLSVCETCMSCNGKFKSLNQHKCKRICSYFKAPQKGCSRWMPTSNSNQSIPSHLIERSESLKAPIIHVRHFISYDIESESSTQTPVMISAHFFNLNLGAEGYEYVNDFEVYTKMKERINHYLCHLGDLNINDKLLFNFQYTASWDDSHARLCLYMKPRQANIDESILTESNLSEKSGCNISAIFCSALIDVCKTKESDEDNHFESFYGGNIFFHQFLLFGYNSSRYDLVLMFKDIDYIFQKNNLYKRKYIQHGGRVHCLDIYPDDDKSCLITFRDIFNIIPAFSQGKSLSSVCSELNLTNQKLTYNHLLFNAVILNDKSLLKKAINPQTGAPYTHHTKHKSSVPDLAFETSNLTEREIFQIFQKIDRRGLLGYFVEYNIIDTLCVSDLIVWFANIFWKGVACESDPKQKETYFTNALQDNCLNIFNFRTLASLSMNFYEAFYRTTQQRLFCFSGESLHFLQQAVIGGKVSSSAFGCEISNQKLGMVDIVSMYPSAFSAPVPFGKSNINDALLSHLIQKDLTARTFQAKNYVPFVARITIEKHTKTTDCKNHDITCFQSSIIKMKNKSLTIVQTGKYEIIRDCVMIQSLQEEGWDITICPPQPNKISIISWSGWTHEEVGPFFEHWFKMKQTSTGPVVILAKILINSVYGKFLQKIDEQYTFKDLADLIYLDDESLEEKDFEKNYSSVNPLVKHIKSNEEKQSVYPLLCGMFCLSFSKRISFIKDIKACGGHAFYTDTDSVLMSYEAIDKFRQANPEIFKKPLTLPSFNYDTFRPNYFLTLEGCPCHQYFTSAIILAKKMYYFENEECGTTKQSCKGHPRNTMYKLYKAALENYQNGNNALNETSRSSMAVTLFAKKMYDENFSIKNKTLTRNLKVNVPPGFTQCLFCDLFFTENVESEIIAEYQPLSTK